MVEHDSLSMEGAGAAAAAIDRSSAGMLVLEGGESKDFLQRISTNNFAAAAPGSAVQTVLTDDKGRVIDVVIAIVREASVALLTSRGRAPAIRAWLERYIIMEDITVRDESGSHACAVIVRTDGSLTPAAARPPAIAMYDIRYYTQSALLVFASSPDELTSFLSSHSISLMSDDQYVDYRIAHGIPEAGKEITEKTNPLEVGLRGLVDFSKGCYIGQEVIARLNTYEKVQRALCRVRVSARPSGENSLEIIGEDARHGYITETGRTVQADGSILALAMLRTASAAEGATYTLSGSDITVTVEQLFTQQ